MSDVLLRCIDREAGHRIVAALTTDLVREAAGRHHAEGLAACALGRALTSSLLLATLTKGGERVTVQIQGDGPIGNIVTDATDAGDVRGYVSRPEAGNLPCHDRPVLSTVLGRTGVVNVVRDLGLKERYAGQVAMVTGEVDEDVEGYLRISEQVPSALGCEVVLDGIAVVASAGILVQALPGGDEGPGYIRQAQHALRSGVLWESLRGGKATLLELAEEVYGRPLEVLDERPVRFQCRCSHERVAATLELLTVVDLDEMIADDGHAKVTCNFCNTIYTVEKPELEEIRKTVAKGPRERN